MDLTKQYVYEVKLVNGWFRIELNGVLMRRCFSSYRECREHMYFMMDSYFGQNFTFINKGA